MSNLLFGLKILLLVSSILLAAQVIAIQKPVIISRNGKATSVIVAALDATEAEQFAAKELKSHLDQITGGSFKIVNPDYKTALTRILVGPSAEVRNLLRNLDFDNLKPDTIVIKTTGNKLILAGDRPRGTIYAVYSFLEDYLGCNWWDQSSSYIPNTKNIVLKKALNKVYSPTFTYRSVWYHYMEYEKGPFGPKLKLNGVVPQPSPQYGGHIKPIISGHSLHYILPPDIYFASHPEWYGLYNGDRQAIIPPGRKNQLCLSNDAMRQEFTIRVLQFIKADPDAEIICVVQEDGTSPCSCTSCQEMSTKYGGSSGALLVFVNQVADEVKKSYPKIVVETFAYQWSLNPPTVAATGLLKKRDNVNLRIAPINEDFGAPWASKRNTRVNDLVQKWKIYANLSIYDYAMNYHQPLILLPNWNTIGANIRYYANNTVKSVLYQGDISNEEANFCRLKAWLIAHLIWDPSGNQNALTKRFLNGYYGTAGPHLYEYIDLTNLAASENTTFMPIWSDDPCFLTSDQLKNAKSLFDKAEIAVRNDPIRLARVKVARLGFDHQLLLSRIAMPRVRSWVSETYRDKLAANFVSLSRNTKNHFVSETVPMPDNYYEVLAEKIEIDLAKNPLPVTRKPAHIPAEVTKLNIPGSEWSDIQENQFQLTAANREIISDSSASNSIGIKMPGGIYDWILQAPIFSRNCIGSNVDLYVTAKITTTLTKGLAFKVEVYDLVGGAYPLKRWVDISEFGGDSGYKEIKIGTFTPSEKHVVICVPYSVANVTDFTVDRLFLIEKK